jgi:hypothetical protein
MIRPPRPILPWHRDGGLVAELLPIGGSGGGLIPAISILSRFNGPVNNITGSSGSCIVGTFMYQIYYTNQRMESQYSQKQLQGTKSS